PYKNLRWMPTGGVNAKNLMDYLSFDKIIACGGTWMVKADLIEAGDWAEITRLTKEAVRSMLGFEVKHIGLNTANDAEAMQAAKLFETLFGFDIAEGNSSIFVGNRGIEIMKKQGRGKYGHIAVGTNTIERAVAHLQSQGIVFDDTSRAEKNGKLVAIYLKEEVAGFAVHLVQK
ncbi:MAG: keto-hydroxyglutarate-aldolase/keto-deoxy-phosphogluconate aldolase, partial [Ruthenibacterium sp.]